MFQNFITVKKSKPKLRNFAQVWQHKNKNHDEFWADEPLTQSEQKELEQGRLNFKNGDYLTLAQFKEQIADI